VIQKKNAPAPIPVPGMENAANALPITEKAAKSPAVFSRKKAKKPMIAL